MKKAAVTTQCAWRVRVARRELRKLKMAAKKAAALQATNSILEKQVEELSSQLELEKRIRFQETKELLMKECEKGKDSTAGAFVVQEAQVIDLEMVNKLVTENEILKASKEAKNKEKARLQSALEEMNLQLQETRALLTIEHETANRTTKNKCLVQDLYVINQEKVNEFTAAERPVAPDVQVIHQVKVNELTSENEFPKDEAKSQENVKLQPALEGVELQVQETNQLLLKAQTPVERIADHVYTAHETQKISMEQVPCLLHKTSSSLIMKLSISLRVKICNLRPQLAHWRRKSKKQRRNTRKQPNLVRSG
ncbi:unnamed protein product [Cuscuta campestris]|uniref:Uncharacterized protein n=1 Tax=Cuscuta campestris TaxID=132261 RepID=A0A484N9X4_9ASTE|nr:unnamed protein product [Cuscuta campestris]